MCVIFSAYFFYAIISMLIDGEGNGNPFQYSYLENPTDRGVLWATVHGVAESQGLVTEHARTHHGYWGDYIYFTMKVNSRPEIVNNLPNITQPTHSWAPDSIPCPQTITPVCSQHTRLLRGGGSFISEDKSGSHHSWLWGSRLTWLTLLLGDINSQIRFWVTDVTMRWVDL